MFKFSPNELRHYVLAHREDEEAWDEYVSRPRPNAVRLHYIVSNLLSREIYN